MPLVKGFPHRRLIESCPRLVERDFVALHFAEHDEPLAHLLRHALNITPKAVLHVAAAGAGASAGGVVAHVPEAHVAGPIAKRFVVAGGDRIVLRHRVSFRSNAGACSRSRGAFSASGVWRFPPGEGGRAPTGA